MRLRIAAAAVLLPAAVCARGGGGGHSGGGGGFHGGGSSGGGYHGSGWSSHIGYGGGYYGSGSDSSNATPFTIFFIFIVVVVIGCKIYQAWYSDNAIYPNGQLFPPDGFAPAPAAQDTERTNGFAALIARDPAFDEERFLSRAEMAFLLVRQAEIRNDADAGRAFVSPEFFGRWAVDLNNRKAANQLLMLGGLNIRRAALLDTHEKESRDCIRAYLEIVCSVSVIDASSERIVAGSPEEMLQPVIVSFERSIHAKTNLAGGAVERKCAACGAPLRLRDTGECAHCDAILTGGAFDWVITHLQNSVPLAPGPVGAQSATAYFPVNIGLEQIQAQDAAFSTDDFLRRVGVTFTAVQAAWSARDLARGRIYMSEGLYLAWSMQIEAMRAMHRINHLENISVQHVAPTAISRSAHFETITVAIQASAVDYETDERTGHIVFGDRTPRPFAEQWVFQRTADATTVAAGLSEGACPACGAPLQLSEIGECAYCSAAVRSGSFDWVLTRIVQFDG